MTKFRSGYCVPTYFELEERVYSVALLKTTAEPFKISSSTDFS